MKKILPILLSSIIFVGCQQENKKINTPLKEPVLKAYINPPMKELNIQKSTYQVVAEKGDTLYHPSGSIIVFPKNAFVDSDGKLLKGKIDVKYREFNDPLDFFLSGIPMAYDSAGLEYQFESSGMIDIKATQNKKAVFVNPKAQPEINMISASTDPKANLYKLDTVARNWTCKGKPVIDSVVKVNKPTEQKDFAFPERPIAQKPLKEPTPPAKINEENPTFSIDIEPGSVKELEVYNNLQFEVLAGDENYKPSDANEVWYDVQLDSTKDEGIYQVTFSGVKRKVTFKARPVFEGKDYEIALKKFKKKQTEYESKVNERLVQEKKLKERNERIAAENETMRNRNLNISKLNALISAKNIEIEKENKRIHQMNKADRKKHEEKKRKFLEQKEKYIAKRKAQILKNQKDVLKRQRTINKREFAEGNTNNYGIIYRSFAIDGFGVWNSDNPMAFMGKKKIQIKALFEDEKGDPLKFQMVNVVYEGFNGLVCNHNPSKKDNSFPKLDIMPNKGNLIWVCHNGILYYLTNDDFKQCKIKNSTRKYTFTLRKHDKKVTSMDELKSILGLAT